MITQETPQANAQAKGKSPVAAPPPAKLQKQDEAMLMLKRELKIQ